MPKLIFYLVLFGGFFLFSALGNIASFSADLEGGLTFIPFAGPAARALALGYGILLLGYAWLVYRRKTVAWQLGFVVLGISVVYLSVGMRSISVKPFDRFLDSGWVQALNLITNVVVVFFLARWWLKQKCRFLPPPPPEERFSLPPRDQ